MTIVQKISAYLLQLRTVLSLVTVEPVLLFYMIGIFLLFSVFHNFVYERTCSSHFPTGLKEASPINGNISSNGQDVCADLTSFPVALAIVQTETSRIIKISTMCMTIPSIIVDCYLGSWSDLFGRKVTLTLPPLGSALGSLVYLILVLDSSLDIYWVLLSSALMGVFGSFTSLLTGVLAYIGATSKAEERTKRMGILLSMSFLAGTFGPFLGGFLFEQFSYAVVFGSKLLCHLTTIFYIVFFLPSPKLASSSAAAATVVAPEDSISGGGFQAETTTSLKREKKSSSSVIRTSVRFTFSEVFSLSHIVKSFRVCFVDRPKAQRTRLILLFVMAFVVMVVSAGELDIAFLFLKDTPIELSYRNFTYWFAARYGLSSLMLMFLLPYLKRMGRGDSLVCAMGLSSKMAALLLLAFSTSTTMVFIEVLVGSLNSLGLASIRAMMSLEVSEEQQGKMYGLMAVIEDISSLLGTLVFNTLYPLTREFFNGTMFVVAASALLIPMIALKFLRDQKPNSPKVKEVEIKTDIGHRS